MIKGAFSGHSPWMQFLMVIFLGLLSITVFTIIGLLLMPVFFPVSLNDVFQMSQAGSGYTVGMLKFLQGLSSLGLFLVPAIIAVHIFSTDSNSYLRVNYFPTPWFVVVVLLIIITLSGNALSDILYRLSKSMPWPESWSALHSFIEASEVSMNEQIQDFLAMASPFDFIQIFFIMAILPALCEEALFRGVLQPVLKRLTGNVHLGVLSTSFCFALMHLQFYTFLPILALGLVLGYVKEWGRSLWPPIIIHLINNGTIVIGVYFFGVDYQSVNDVGASLDLQYSLPGLLIFGSALYLLYRLLHNQNKSPVQEDRANIDF